MDASPRRLGTDWIDLYQLHRPDPRTDLEETLAVLTDLVRAGKIRAFGCSTFPPEEIAEAHAVADARGLMRLRTEQPPYSILSRGIERPAGGPPPGKRFDGGLSRPGAVGWKLGDTGRSLIHSCYDANCWVDPLEQYDEEKSAQWLTGSLFAAHASTTSRTSRLTCPATR